jgi:hypothetical protein
MRLSHLSELIPSSLSVSETWECTIHHLLYMELTRRTVIVLWITVSLILIQSPGNVQGRYHYHKKNGKGSQPPTPSQESPPESQPEPVAPSTPSTNPPNVPSDPYPDDPGTNSNTTDCTFNVMSFGAVGDGDADDTEAFRDAWKAACAVESAVVLAPADYCFKITSTIFSGPCQPGLVFQVRIATFSY